MTLGRAAAAEAIGTALLLAIVVGSGIMGERLSQGNAAVALLANSIATGAGLYSLIVIFGSGRLGGKHLGGTPPGTTRARLRAGSNLWSLRWCCHRSRDVWSADHSDLNSYSPDTGRGPWRSRRDVRPRPDNFPGIEVSGGVNPCGGCSIYYQRILVYVLDLICQSGCHFCARNDRYVRGNLAA